VQKLAGTKYQLNERALEKEAETEVVYQVGCIFLPVLSVSPPCN